MVINHQSKSSFTKLAEETFKNMSAEGKLFYLSEYMSFAIDLRFNCLSFENWTVKRLIDILWKAKITELYIFYHTCFYCGSAIRGKDKTRDHFTPVSRGGKEMQQNIVPCCYSCNQWKADKTPEQWLNELSSLSSDLKKNKRKKRYKRETIEVMKGAITKRINFNNLKTKKLWEQPLMEFTQVLKEQEEKE